MHGNLTEVVYSDDEMQAIRAYAQSLIEQELYGPGITDFENLKVVTLLDTTAEALDIKPEVVDNVAYVYQDGSLWKQDPPLHKWQAKKLEPFEDSLYDLSGLYAENGRAHIDIVRLRT